MVPKYTFGEFKRTSTNYRKNNEMIGYITLGTNFLERAVEFYDSLLHPLGAHRFARTEQMAAWRSNENAIALMLTQPFDQKPSTIGNGTMLALQVESQAEVDELYKNALRLGAADEGPPGPRGGSGFYAAYFRDLDGHKLNVFFSGS